MNKLVKNLQRAGQTPGLLKFQDGTGLLILPHGGRVLGVFTHRSSQNFLWTNPALESANGTREFFQSADWHNSGGDRTWLAPEMDLFFPAYPRLDKYFQQRSLDPGQYRWVKRSGQFELTNRLAVHLSRSGEDLKLSISKRFAPAANPLRHEQPGLPAGVQFAGYTQTTLLQMLGSSRRTPWRIGLWQLIQLPHGGELLIPTTSRAGVWKIFSSTGRIPQRDVVVTDHLVRYRMNQKGEHKISLRAVTLTGRMGYVWASAGTWSLVVRNFNLNPSGEYVDAPWTDPENLGFAVQACNVNSRLGAFSEMEHHVPAIGGPGGRSLSIDESQLWCFRGTRPAIERIARILLAPRISLRAG
ncbi:MAG: hypothetical protein FJ405_15135 [Verrucomicrobia bacterium]|nr:hypothetical protein [Verrucomicrobiota bacterium]